MIALIALVAQVKFFILAYAFYFLLSFLLALVVTKQFKVAILVLPAIAIQFLGYGLGFLTATLAVVVFKQQPELRFPKLFFKS
jgi:hypothetical protein